MNVCFAVSDLSSLRYYGPVIEYIKDEKNIDVFLCVRRDSGKYNALKSDRNYEILKNIVASLHPAKIIPMKDSKIRCDILFTIENVDNHRFDYNRHYAIQHGFDYKILGKLTDSKTIYLCHSDVYGLDLLSRYKTKYLISPLPVAFSNPNKQIKFARNLVTTNKDIAFIFFPFKGHVSLTRSIVSYLKKMDYYVIIKQRRKWQQVSKNIGADLIVYDDIWYPSESIFYPLISKLVIGFGTSSYTDLCEIGINYIDKPITKYAKTDDYFIKPNLKNYWSIEKKFKRRAENIIEQISKENYGIKNVPEDIVKKFFLDLLKI
jgi:hypothetical protein